MSQQHGYVELLLLGETIDRAPDHPLSNVLVGSSATPESSLPIFDSQEPVAESPLSLEPELSYAALIAQLSPEQLAARFSTEVETEVAIWLGIGILPLETNPNNSMQKENVNIVDFWKPERNGEVLPLIRRMAVDVLPAQASSVSSEQVFSSSKLTCTREWNRISSELVEALQVVKHSIRQQRSLEPGARLLDFSERIAPLGDDIVE